MDENQNASAPDQPIQDKPFDGADAPLQDKQIICAKCAKPFVWTSDEQRYYKQKGLQHEPKLCVNCRQERKNLAPKEVECIKCSRHGHVKGDIPGTQTYCEPCFEAMLEEAKKKGEKIEEIRE
jgi:hypothetical protein